MTHVLFIVHELSKASDGVGMFKDKTIRISTWVNSILGHSTVWNWFAKVCQSPILIDQHPSYLAQTPYRDWLKATVWLGIKPPMVYCFCSVHPALAISRTKGPIHLDNQSQLSPCAWRKALCSYSARLVLAGLEPQPQWFLEERPWWFPPLSTTNIDEWFDQWRNTPKFLDKGSKLSYNNIVWNIP